MTGEEMRTIRENLNLTRGLFAQAVGVSPTVISLMERGRRSISDRTAGAVLSCVHLTEAVRLGMDNPESLASVVVKYTDGKSDVVVRLRNNKGQGVKSPIAGMETSIRMLLYWLNDTDLQKATTA